MGQVGAIYVNFGLWAVAIFPAWLVVRQFGQDVKPRQPEEIVAPSEDTVADKS
jgi:hypothetical protein